MSICRGSKGAGARSLQKERGCSADGQVTRPDLFLLSFKVQPYLITHQRAPQVPGPERMESVCRLLWLTETILSDNPRQHPS